MTTSPEEGESLKKVVIWLVVAFVVFCLIRYPQTSAGVVENVGQALGNAASSLGDFVGSLV